MATSYLEACYAIPCDILGVVPFDELYVMSTRAKWPERRVEVILAHPELFDHDLRFGGNDDSKGNVS